MNTKNTKKIFISLFAISFLAMSSSSFAKKQVVMEKCMGLAKAGMGDGIVTVDGQKREWLYLPAGQCQKFVGGEVYINTDK